MKIERNSALIEVWKEIPGYEGLYQVSNFGRVKRNGKIRIPRKKNNGYLAINLSKNGIIRWVGLHRLVALAFIQNPNNLPCVNHKDEDKTNNTLDNLEWCSHRYNCMYGIGRERQKLSRKNNPNDKIIRKRAGEKIRKPIRCFTTNGELIGEYESATKASLATGVHISTISRHCKGKTGCKNQPIRKYRFEYAI